jgi:hypothetical protein
MSGKQKHINSIGRNTDWLILANSVNINTELEDDFLEPKNNCPNTFQ